MYYNVKHRLLSLLLIVLMVLSMLPSAFAASNTDSSHGDSDNVSGGGKASWTWNYGPGGDVAQFLRMSIYWAPIDKTGKALDWSGDPNNNPQGEVFHKVGSTFDYYDPNFYSNKGHPQVFGTFGKNDINYYMTSDDYNFINGAGTAGQNYTYFSAGVSQTIAIPKDQQEAAIMSGGINNGTVMKFPIIFGDKRNGVTIKDFFSQPKTWNDVLYSAQNRTCTDAGIPKNPDGSFPVNDWIDIKEFYSGIWQNVDGKQFNGGYVMTVEPGVYGTSNGKRVAYTLRDLYAVLGASNSAWTNTMQDIAESTYIEESIGSYKALGFGNTAPCDNVATKEEIKAGFPFNKSSTVLDRMGLAVVTFDIPEQKTPVVKYFYDLSSMDKDEWGKIEASEFDKLMQNKAKNIRIENTGATYKVVSEDSSDGEGKDPGYLYTKAVVTSKSEIQGSINQVNFSTVFTNINKTNSFTEEAKKVLTENKIPDTFIATNDVKNWYTASGLVTTVQRATTLSGLKSKEEIFVRDKNGLTFNAGGSNGDLQLMLLYVKGPEDTPIHSDPVPDKMVDVPSKPTNVTKMYFDTPESTVPTGKDTGSFGKDATYVIENDKPNYKVTEWVIVDDKTPNTPEPYPDWTTVKDNVSEAGKTDKTLGPLGPTNWNDPDRELFIRYEKITEPEKPAVDGELYIPERRISWKKSLSDIGGIPTINFSWPAITGEHLEYDGCGTKKRPCPGHTCTEHVEDGTLTFVSSNTTAVKDSIMGNRTGFMPFDTDNFHSLTRSNSEGEYNMKPNYHFVVWRGQDVPTIASYKYGDTTGNGLAPSAPMIKSLIGEAQAGISGKPTRKSDKNNSYYMDSFIVTEGKTLSDTGNMSAFMSFYKGDLANANAALSNLVKNYETAFIAHEDAKPVWKSAQESWSSAQSTWSSIQKRYDSWDREYRSGKSDYEAAEKAYKEAQVKYEDIKKDMEDKATKLTGDKTSIGGHLADYRYSTRWSWGEFGGWHEADGGSTTFNPQVRVDVGFGTPNVGDKKVDFKSTNLNAFGKDYKNVTGFPINNAKTINFWPYVEMIYDTTIGQEGLAVNVLGGHESKLTPQDYVEIGYLPVSANSETSTGLMLQSKQWSTHQSALKLASGTKNKVLPGGAIYRLTTPGAGTGSSTATTIAVSSWLTFLPSDTINATTSGKDIYNGTAQNNRNEGLYRQVLNSLNSLDIVQIVNGTQVLQELAGNQKVSGTSGQPTSKEPKYWLNQNIKDGTGNASVPASNDAAMKINSVKPNEADLDITNTKEERIYYRIYSDTKGNVYVSKSKVSAADTALGKGEVIATAKKSEGADTLLKNNEIKALNNRTNLVTNYLAAIDRNIGNDKELIALGGDGKWYNEAFDGICVVRINKQIEVGFKDGNMSQAARTAALDTKLEPVRKSQADLFKTKADSWFEADKHTNLSNEAGYVGTFTNSESGAPATKITIKDMNGIYKSKIFYIPNASVTDLY